MASNVTNIIELRGKPDRIQELLKYVANDEAGCVLNVVNAINQMEGFA